MSAAPRSARDRLHPAYVLHRRDYSDTSLLVEVLSPGHGRFPALAKGARRPRGSGPLLQPFTPLLLAWSGRGEVRTLVRVEPNGRPLTLPGDALLCGFYVNELLMRLLGRQDPHEALFLFYQAALSELASGGDLGTPLRRFELRLLAEIGYGPILDREANGDRPIDLDQSYVYSEERGLTRAGDPGADDAISGRTLLGLVSGAPLAGAEAREARRLARRLLAPHLGDRPLRSRALFGARWKHPAGRHSTSAECSDCEHTGDRP